jgi:5-methylcytosine-specific restriction endonuclease McrA
MGLNLMLNKCKAINRFYRSAEWQIARAEKIASVNGRCEKCGAIGEEVHHIIPLTTENINNPEITLGKGNLILLCKDCHNEEHGRFKKTEPQFDCDGNLIPY